jgi:GntR family transcriptional regulator, transcriptional repressor for pyruvate dehydrogenase complex
MYYILHLQTYQNILLIQKKNGNLQSKTSNHMDGIKIFSGRSFSSLEASSLVDQVEIKLIDFLIDSKLKPGDMIPREIELAENLGVSRTVVRESFNRLKTIGLIESIKHKGTIIKSPDLLQLLKKSMIPAILTQGTLIDIFELRLSLEIGMADLIFMRKTPEDIEELYEIVSLEPEKTTNLLFDAQHEIKFHGKLYKISGNTTMMEFQNLLLPMFRYIYESRIIAISGKKKKKHVTHRQLVDIIRYNTPEKFRNAMRAHLDNHFLRLAAARRNLQNSGTAGECNNL